MSAVASICIAAFNKPDLLKNTLDSIFIQTPPFNFEVIVVDDGSLNAEVSEVCKDYPVICKRIERTPVFRNPAKARNEAYKLASADIVIAQSDEVLHVNKNTIEKLVTTLKEGHFVIATVFCLNRKGGIGGLFTGLKRRVPFFFLGSLYRKDIYAVGGNDEDFDACPAYEDNWFSECLYNGLGLEVIFTTEVVGHHQWHPLYNDPKAEQPSAKLFWQKMADATNGKIPWCSSGGPWKMQTTEDIFTELYTKREWGTEETISGRGSTLEATRVIQKSLLNILQLYGIKSLLDLPCGDFNWMSAIELGGISYIGGDIVRDIIAQNKERYPRVDFRHLDLLTSDLPKVDCLFCRDCLTHFSFEDVKKALMNIRRAGVKYIITTTFPQHSRNKLIYTGQWSPYNMQEPPFSFPAPLLLLNEDCRECYPSFNDKSLALWEVRELEKVLFPTNSLVVCVEYDDFLRITLPHNMKHFKKTVVVTSFHDVATQRLCEELACEYHVTDSFYKDKAFFNKGVAVEEGLDVLRREDWICIWDADIVMPPDIYVPNKNMDCLYSTSRVLLEDPSKFNDDLDWDALPSPSRDTEFAGYFQLFHSHIPIARPWYSIDWAHAGGCDSDFQFKFAKEKLRRLPFKVLHLGSEGIVELGTRVGRNWCGRVSPRIDNGTTAHNAEERYKSITQIIADRKLYGTKKERIIVGRAPVKPEVIIENADMIPRMISFFWSGKMSWLRYLTLQTFRQLNPDWRINLYLYNGQHGDKKWKSAECDDTDYSGEDYLDRVGDLNINIESYVCPIENLPPAQVSDIFEWDILGTIGGFYGDMDILWLRPLDIVWHSHKTIDVICCLEQGLLAIGFFGAKPGCILFKDIHNTALRRNKDNPDYQNYGTSMLYSMFSQSIHRRRRVPKPQGEIALVNMKQQYTQLRFIQLPDAYIYPLDWSEIPGIFEMVKPLHPNAVALHWFGGSAISQKWNRLLTPTNWKEYNNTFIQALHTVIR